MRIQQTLIALAVLLVTAATVLSDDPKPTEPQPPAEESKDAKRAESESGNAKSQERSSGGAKSKQ